MRVGCPAAESLALAMRQVGEAAGHLRIIGAAHHWTGKLTLGSGAPILKGLYASCLKGLYPPAYPSSASCCSGVFADMFSI